MRQQRKEKRVTRGVLSSQGTDHPPKGICQSTDLGGSFVFSRFNSLSPTSQFATPNEPRARSSPVPPEIYVALTRILRLIPKTPQFWGEASSSFPTMGYYRDSPRGAASETYGIETTSQAVVPPVAVGGGFNSDRDSEWAPPAAFSWSDP